MAASSRVDATAYATKVCTAIAGLHRDTVTAGQPVLTATQAYKASPSTETARQLRDSYVKLLRQLETSMAGVRRSTQAAGIPKVGHGSKFAQAVLRYEQVASQKLETLAVSAAAIPVDDTASFARSYSSLLATVSATGASMRATANQDPTMQQAPAALAPLARYFKTSANTCTG
jgi:hypothetical protein